MLDSFYIAIILAGFGGGAVRSVVGYYKSLSFQNPSFDVKYFIMMTLLSGFIGLVTAVVTKELDISILGVSGSFTPAIAFLVGYAGGDFLENIYKIFLKKPATTV
jgi:hypothetical protein